MPFVLDKTQIKAIGYNSLSIQDESLTDGINFNGTGNFLLIANRPIPKNAQTYMELTITSTPANKDIRHIPLFLGIHKEPSFGVLGSDFCLGSIYYTKNSYYAGMDTSEYLAYRAMEKYAARPVINAFVQETKSRVPIKGTVIGIGVNMTSNLITLYSDGKEFYGFKPDLYNMNDDEHQFYFAIYSAESGENVSGILNFGRYGTVYLPEGYNNFHQELYSKKTAYEEFDCRISVGQRFVNDAYDKDVITGFIKVENNIAPVTDNRRDLELVCNHPNDMIWYSDLSQTEVNKHAFKFTSNSEDPDLAYINYPLDHYKRLYFEFYCSSATLINDSLGIPISIGITKDPTDITQESYRIDLSHLRTDGYHLITMKNGFEFIEGNYNILNPSSPIQPNTIGVIVDLLTNTIELYTEGVLFTRVTVNTDIADFSNCEDLVYFFFRPIPDKFSGTGRIICNFGTQRSAESNYEDPTFKFPHLVDNDIVYDLWTYYNYTIKDINVMEFPCTMKVISDHLQFSKLIYASITVPESKSEWGNGLNKMWGTYNKVSRIKESQNVPSKSIFDLQKLIEADKENNRR